MEEAVSDLIRIFYNDAGYGEELVTFSDRGSNAVSKEVKVAHDVRYVYAMLRACKMYRCLCIRLFIY